MFKSDIRPILDLIDSDSELIAITEYCLTISSKNVEDKVVIWIANGFSFYRFYDCFENERFTFLDKWRFGNAFTRFKKRRAKTLADRVKVVVDKIVNSVNSN